MSIKNVSCRIIGNGGGNGNAPSTNAFLRKGDGNGTQKGTVTYKPYYLGSLHCNECDVKETLERVTAVTKGRGNCVITATDASGIGVFDVDNPNGDDGWLIGGDANIRYLGGLVSPVSLTNPVYVQADSSHIFVADGFNAGGSKVLKFNYEDKSNVFQVPDVFQDASFTDPLALKLCENYFAVSDISDHSVFIVDKYTMLKTAKIENPITPDPFFVVSMEKYDNYLILLCTDELDPDPLLPHTRYLVFVDVSNLTNPVTLPLVEIASVDIREDSKVRVVDNFLYIMTWGQFSIFPLDDIPNITEGSRIGVIYTQSFEASNDFFVFGNYSIFVRSEPSSDAAFIVDHTDKTTPFVVNGSWKPLIISSPQSVVVIGNTAYYADKLAESSVGADNGRLVALDVNGVSFSSVEVGTANVKGNARVGGDLDVSGIVKAKSAKFEGITEARNSLTSMRAVRSLEDFPDLKSDINITGDLHGNNEIDGIASTDDIYPGMPIVTKDKEKRYFIPTGLYVGVVNPNSLVLSGSVSVTEAGVELFVNPYIELSPYFEYYLDRDIYTPYSIHVSPIGNSGIAGMSDRKLIFTGTYGSLLGGELLVTNSFFAILDKLFMVHLAPTTSIFGIEGDLSSTFFSQNIVIVRAPGYAYQNLGHIYDANISTQVAQVRGWATGLHLQNNFKVKMNDWSARDGQNVGGTFIKIDGVIPNAFDIKGFDSTLQPSEYMFFIDPATVEALPGKATFLSDNAIGGTFWAPGSATEKTVGMDVKACSVPDSTVSLDAYYESNPVLQTTLINAGVYNHINYTFNSPSELSERIQFRLQVRYELHLGTFVIGDTVTGAVSGATGIIYADDSSFDVLTLINVSGSFQEGEPITTPTVNALIKVNSINTPLKSEFYYLGKNDVVFTANGGCALKPALGPAQTVSVAIGKNDVAIERSVANNTLASGDPAKKLNCSEVKIPMITGDHVELFIKNSGSNPLRPESANLTVTI